MMISLPRSLSVAHACALALSITASVTFSQTHLPEPGVPQSVGVQLKTHNFNVQTIDATYEMGFRAIRRGIYWDAVETEKGKYDFSKFDEQLNHAKQRGIRVVACLFGGNKMYEDDGRGGIQTEAGRAGMAAFAAAAAEHYKDHDLLWEIWNEPNVRTFWRKDGMHNSDEFAQEYTDLVKAITPAMLKADPEAFVMAGSVSNYWQPSYNWTEACFKMGILTSGIRGWSVHPYGVKTPEEFSIGHGITRKLLQQYGAPDLPMINTERGFAIKKPQGQLELEGWSGGKGDQVRNFQAAHFVRQFMVDQLHDVRLTIWYEWDGDEFGIIGKDGERPIEAVARVMTQRLNGYTLEKRLETDNKLDYLLLWKDAAGNRQLVAWTAPPPGGAPDEAEPHEVSIQATGGGSFEIADLFGKTASAPALKLTLSGMPQYVALPKGVELGQITTAAPAPRAAAQQPAASGVDLALFAQDADWKFLKNTGEGGFSVKQDGDEAIGVMQYDFTASKAKSTPYVLAQRDVSIQAAEQLSLDARSSTPQPLTFRIIDSTKQTHQFKHRLKGTGQWENIRIPLNRKLEHWGGENDGKIHFPIEQIALSVPRPREDHKTGSVEYARGIAVTGSVSPAASGNGQPAESAAVPANAAGKELKLFDGSTEWTFEKNTGDGSFEVTTDAGKAIGVVNFDFSKSQSKSTPYVLASAPVEIAEGPGAVQFAVRAARPQKVTVRLVDATGQTHQFKGSAKGTGAWETIKVPLTRKLEHWGGDNDGKIHYPIQRLVLSLPAPAGEVKTGKVEFAEAMSIGK